MLLLSVQNQVFVEHESSSCLSTYMLIPGKTLTCSLPDTSSRHWCGSLVSRKLELSVFAHCSENKYMELLTWCYTDY